MKWRGGRQSSNVEDRSGRSAGSGGKIMAGGVSVRLLSQSSFFYSVGVI